MDLAYAALMSMCTEGTYLYTPPRDKVFHPGSCGFFDDGGRWSPITDLTTIQKSDPDGYKPPNKPLVLTDPTTCEWKKKLVEKNEGSGFGAKAEVSGIAAQAPVDVGANFAVGSTAKAGAGVVVSPNVVHKRFDTKALNIICSWMNDNMKTLTANHEQQLAEFGVWIVMNTWVADKCDIAMWNKTGSKLNAGVEVGATNIGKIGLNGSHEVQTDVDEHKVFNEPGGHAVSFSGVHFRPSKKFWSNKLKQKGPSDGYLRADPSLQTMDQEGNLYNEHGHLINERGQLIDKSGRLVDEDDNLVDEEGHTIDENGKRIDVLEFVPSMVGFTTEEKLEYIT